MGQGRLVAKECGRLLDLYHSGKITRTEMDSRLDSLIASQKKRMSLLGLYHDGEISRAEMDRQLKTLNASTQSALPFGTESSDATECIGSPGPHNTGTQTGRP